MVWPTKYDVKLGLYDAMQLPGQQVTATYANTELDQMLNLDMYAPAGCQRLTGILVTMGPSTNNIEIMHKMMEAGMNIALLNFEFGSAQDHIKTIENLKQAAKDYSSKIGKVYPLAIAARLAGYKLYTGRIANYIGETVELKTGEKVNLSSNEYYRIMCTRYTIFVNFKHQIDRITKDTQIFLDEDNIVLKVEMITGEIITCLIEKGGTLGSYKDIYIPGLGDTESSLSKQDKHDIEILLEQELDILIMASAVSKKCVKDLKQVLGEKGKSISIVAKITTVKGFLNFKDILLEADAVAISRPELAEEIFCKDLILLQKNMISQANKANIPVIVLARLLSSMKKKKNPARCELADIWNCILDGADCLALSSETAIGSYPVETVACLASMCKEAEAAIWTKDVFYKLLEKTPMPCDILTGTILGAVLAVQRVTAAAIIVATKDGKSVQLLSKYRPKCPIIAVTRYPAVAKKLHLWRGIIPLLYLDTPEKEWTIDIRKRFNFSMKWAIEQGFVRVNDPLVLIYQHRNLVYTMNIVYIAPDATIY